MAAQVEKEKKQKKQKKKQSQDDGHKDGDEEIKVEEKKEATDPFKGVTNNKTSLAPKYYRLLKLMQVRYARDSMSFMPHSFDRAQLEWFSSSAAQALITKELKKFPPEARKALVAAEIDVANIFRMQLFLAHHAELKLEQPNVYISGFPVPMHPDKIEANKAHNRKVAAAAAEIADEKARATFIAEHPSKPTDPLPANALNAYASDTIKWYTVMKDVIKRWENSDLLYFAEKEPSDEAVKRICYRFIYYGTAFNACLQESHCLPPHDVSELMAAASTNFLDVAFKTPDEEDDAAVDEDTEIDGAEEEVKENFGNMRKGTVVEKAVRVMRAVRISLGVIRDMMSAASLNHNIIPRDGEVFMPQYPFPEVLQTLDGILQQNNLMDPFVSKEGVSILSPLRLFEIKCINEKRMRAGLHAPIFWFTVYAALRNVYDMFAANNEANLVKRYDAAWALRMSTMDLKKAEITTFYTTHIKHMQEKILESIEEYCKDREREDMRRRLVEAINVPLDRTSLWRVFAIKDAFKVLAETGIQYQERQQDTMAMRDIQLMAEQRAAAQNGLMLPPAASSSSSS